jgi:RNA polymerase sigma-70 factor, ECF subfamily
MALSTSPLRGDLLAAATGGDPQAFQLLVDPHRPELHAHCYRMLGSLHDADDALQDALLRAWRGLHGVREPAGLRAWLYRIATNCCIDVANRRPARTLPMDVSDPFDPHADAAPPLTEVAWLEPYPDRAAGLVDGRAAPEARYEQREAVELAFVAALQHLPPNQRATLILRDVLGYSARETADLLDTSVASVTSALQRARQTVEERIPATTQAATLRRLRDARLQDLVDDFMAAWTEADVSRLTSILADDVTFSMPPHASWWRGRDNLITFLQHAKQRCPPNRWVPTGANGQTAFGCYLLDDATGSYLPATITMLDFDGERVREVTSFVFPELFPRFGLPASVSA